VSTATERDIIYKDRDHCIGVHGSTLVAFSLQSPNPVCLAAWTTALVQLAQRSDGPISILIIVDSGARPPDDARSERFSGLPAGMPKALAPLPM